MNFFIMLCLCSIWVIVRIRFVVVIFLCNFLVSLKFIIFGISMEIGWFNIVVFVLILLMFYFSMLRLLIMVVCELVLMSVFG